MKTLFISADVIHLSSAAICGVYLSQPAVTRTVLLSWLVQRLVFKDKVKLPCV